MSDYSSVAPPQSNLNQSQAFAAALQRAKQIAAKIQPGGQQAQQPQQGGGYKRSLEDDTGPDAKKFSSPDSYSNSSSQPNMSQALAQAAAVAARLAATGGSTVEEQLRYPDKIVGMMVGRSSNENLSHIQAESGCKVQLSSESERCCTLRGSREAVTKGREMIQHLANQNGGGSVEVLISLSMPPPGPGGYPPFQEIMVPGPKVGLVIGKGGETIKMLQEKTGAKMVIIQEGPNQEAEKPLRISGDPQKIEHAKNLVFDLIRDKEATSSGGFQNSSNGGENAEVYVPKTAVGVVIGKGGEMIKKIQGETGCKLQFVQGKNDDPGDRRCVIQGTCQQVEDGKRMIEGLVESVLQRSNQQGNNRNNGQNDNSGSNYGYGYGVNHTQQPAREEVTFSVPASKCGIVIGRGGETIKLINQQTGAYCEMDRSAVNPPSEKMFKAKGTTEQIEHARQLISEKINIDLVIASRKPIGNAPNHQNNNYNNNDQNAGYQQQQQQQQQQWGYGQQGWDQSQQQQVPVGQAGAGSADYSSQWIEYYKSMGMHREAEAIEQQLKQKQPQPQQMAVAAQNGSSGGGSHPSMPQAQSQDYSAQWAEYYRSMGKMEEADQIEKQMAAQKAGGQSNPGQQQPQGASGSAPQPHQQAQQAGYPQGMTAAQYAQYSQYYAAAAAAGQGGYPGQAYPGYGMYPGAPGQSGQPGGQQQQQPQQKKPNENK